MTGVLGWWDRAGGGALLALGHVGAMARFARRWMYWAFLGPIRERTIFRPDVIYLMEEAGNRSLPIVAVVSFLIGIILVYQTGDVMRDYGAISKVPKMVVLSITRELGPIMTAIMVIARVGSSYTAGLGMMKHSEEISALETMAINPIGFLVAPRAIALMVMMPVLTVLGNIVGVIGGAFVAYTLYAISPVGFFNSALDSLKMPDVLSGVVKSFVFALVIVTVTCYMGFTVHGGPKGVMKNTQTAVVSSIVLVIFVDSIISAIVANFFL